MKWKEKEKLTLKQWNEMKGKKNCKQWYEAASYEIARPQAVTLWAGFIKHFTLKVLVEGLGEHSLKVSLQMNFFIKCKLILLSTPRWSWNHPNSSKQSFNSNMFWFSCCYLISLKLLKFFTVSSKV